MRHRELFRIEGIPIYQNKMFDSAGAAAQCPLGDVVLVQDVTTGLVFNNAFEEGKLNYDETYQNEQGLSPMFRSHLNEVLQIVYRNFHGQQIMEVGCGKGAFLNLMRERGFDAIGVDPAYEGDSPYILKQHFDSSLGVKADSIVLRHVLEHIPQPLDFLRSIAAIIADCGKIYIEVPSLEWILEHRAWFDIFYEHVNYFRISDFTRMFQTVFEAGHIFDGQYIYVVADLSSFRAPREADAVEHVTFPHDFLHQLDELSKASSQARRRVVWGGGAKGVVFSHHLIARGMSLDFAIDINPAKQGKFLAGSALPVLSPKNGLPRLTAGDDIFVMNSNYLGEISTLGGSHINYIPVDQQ